MMIEPEDQSNEVSSIEDSDMSLYERLRPIFGIANDLPKDGSINLDHYLYGTPKI